MTLQPTVRVDIVGRKNIAMGMGWFMSISSLCHVLSAPVGGEYNICCHIIPVVVTISTLLYIYI